CGTTEVVPFPISPSENLVCFSCPLHILQVDAFLRHFVERRKFAEALYRLDYAVGYVVDLGGGVEAADAEADRAVRQIVAGAESLQYIRWFKRRRGACRTARNCNIVDAHQQRLAFHIGKADVQVAGQAMLHGAVDVSFIEAVHDAVAQTIAQGTELNRFARHFFGCNGAGLAESDDSRHIQRPGAHAALVTAAVDDGRDLHSRILAADVQRPYALGTVHLMA